MRIVFFGTPEFAVASLEAILSSGFEVAAVVTAPDKPAGRGMQLNASPVKQFALAHHLPVLQPDKLRDPDFLDALRSLKADLQVIIAFRMLPESVWSMPPLGTVNLHASLLPDYRGAAPINHAIINGEDKTGISTFFLKHEIDTGDILLRDEVEITSGMTAGELHDVLMQRGARLIVETLKAIRDGSTHPLPQSATSHKTAPKLFTEDCRIHWERTGLSIHNLVRGLSPYPGAFTMLKDRMLKIYRVAFVPEEEMTADPGKVETDHKTYFRFACADGWIYAEDMQLQGKKRMPVKDFLMGYRD